MKALSNEFVTSDDDRDVSTNKDSTNRDQNQTEWNLSGKKKVSIQSFKGNRYIHIREFYKDSDGSDKPGKKGIALNINELKALADIIGDVYANAAKK
jgi:hypothetical protein